MPLGQNFNAWLKDQGKEPYSPELESVLDDIGREMAGDEVQRAIGAAAIAKSMAVLLRQEYKLHEGRWWLWSLDKPARPLTDAEIQEHKLEREDKS